MHLSGRNPVISREVSVIDPESPPGISWHKISFQMAEIMKLCISHRLKKWWLGNQNIAIYGEAKLWF